MGFWSGVSDYVFGGNATKGMATDPQTGGYQRDYLKNMLQRPAPQMNAGQADQSRGQMQNLASMLQQTASGQTPGAGEMAVNRQAGQAQAQQTAQAQMARGADAAMAARNAARSSADIGTNAAGQAAQAQITDQANAQAQLSGLLGNMRQGDIGVANANLGANMNQQNLQISALAQMLGVDEAALRAQAAKAGVDAGDKGMFGSLLQAGGQVGAAAVSDERAKHSVEDASDDIDDMLIHLEPKSWQYKDEKHGKGDHYGVMAQDLERSAVGSTAVYEVDGVKRLDLSRLVPVLLATVAQLDARVRELEGK